jgi:hypothetical protein
VGQPGRVLHRAAPYDPASRREMLRTTVLGDEDPITHREGIHMVKALLLVESKPAAPVAIPS